MNYNLTNSKFTVNRIKIEYSISPEINQYYFIIVMSEEERRGEKRRKKEKNRLLENLSADHEIVNACVVDEDKRVKM